MALRFESSASSVVEDPRHTSEFAAERSRRVSPWPSFESLISARELGVLRELWGGLRRA